MNENLYSSKDEIMEFDSSTVLPSNERRNQLLLNRHSHSEDRGNQGPHTLQSDQNFLIVSDSSGYRTSS